MTRDFARLALAATLITVAAACSPVASTAPPTTPALTADEEQALQHVLRDLVNVDDTTTQETNLLAEAEAELTYRCLREAGVDWRPPGPSNIPVASNPFRSISRSDLWLPLAGSLTDPEAWAAYRATLRAKQTAMSAYPPPPPGYEDAMYGESPREITIDIGNGGLLTIPIGGCASKVVEQLYGVDAASYHRARTAALVASKLMGEVVADETVAEATRAWSACMRRRGYRLSTPDDLRDPLEGAYEAFMSGSGTIDELAALDAQVGTADAECKQQSGLATVFARALIKIGEDRLEQNEGVLTAYLRYRRQGLDRAAQIVAGTFPDYTGHDS